MRKRFLSLFLLCVFASNICLCAPNYKKDRENWLPRLKEIYGDEQPSVKMSDTIDNTREYKYPGQRFSHNAAVQLDGKGKLVKKHKYWVDREKYLQLQHQSSFIILEEIISSDEELDDGIIKSHFTVQHFNEQLLSAKAGMKIGFIDSKGIINTIKGFKASYGSMLDKAADNFIKASLATATAAILAAGAPEPVVTKVGSAGGFATAATLAGIGGTIKIFLRITDYVSDQTDEEGNIILSREKVNKICPEADMMIQKLHRLEGIEIYTTWIAQNGKRNPKDIGYTQLDIDKKHLYSDVTEDDKEMLTKMIYRANPFGVKTILPDDKKGIDNTWEIEANNVMTWMATAGVKYDTVNGTIRVRDEGSRKSSDYEDEQSLQKKKEIVVEDLRAITKNNPRLRFMKKMKDSSQVKMSVIPTSGNIVIVESNENAPRYVKEVNVKGRIETHIDKPTGLLADIEYEENSVMINYSYAQVRWSIKAGNKASSKGTGK